MRFLKRTGFCAIIGLLVALGTAFACYVVCIRPTERGRHELRPDQVACYAGDSSWLATLPLEFPLYTELSNDYGFGFRQITLLLPTSLETRPPTYTAQHLLTTLGWPQPIFSTGSDWLASSDFRFPTRGNTFPVEIHADLVPQATPSATTLHWSGIIFDTITFGLPVLSLMMVATAVVGRTDAWLRRAVVIATASWWLAIAVPATGVFALFQSTLGPGLHDPYEFRILPSQTGQRVIPHATEEWLPVITEGEKEPAAPFTYKFEKVPTASEEWILVGVDEMAAIQCEPPLCHFAVSWREHVHNVPQSKFTQRIGDEVSAGWPAWAFNKGDGTYSMFVNDLSHLDVRWLPWLANVAMMLPGVAIICFIIEFICRRFRVAPGHCAGCGYQVKDAIICPECGRASTSKQPAA